MLIVYLSFFYFPDNQYIALKMIFGSDMHVHTFRRDKKNMSTNINTKINKKNELAA